MSELIRWQDKDLTEYYEAESVDTVLAEKDKEIALLKERICNGDVSRLTWIDDCIAKDKEITELKGRLASAEEDRDYFKNIRNKRHEEEIADLKAKLENVQASMYCDVVDANMENRRLKRALWLARTERSTEKVDLFWYARASTELLDINGRPDRIPEPKGWWRQLKATEWMCIWQEVERKCRAKAEEYK